MAALFQCAAFHRLWLDRARRLRSLLLAGIRTSTCRTDLELATAPARSCAAAVAACGNDSRRNWRCRTRCCTALQKNHQYRMDFETAAGRRARNDGLDHRCGFDSL